MSTLREFDLVIFGATGYTGKLTAEAVLKQAPTSLRWAIAGRSEAKLQALKEKWMKEFPDRREMEVIICDLSPSTIDAMTKRTTLLITTVGPFLRYGTPVLESCVNNGTHYIDSTGEYPWVKAMVERFHDAAKEKGVIVVPQCGFDSVPADLCAWKLVKTLRDELGTGAGKTTFALHKLSGGMTSGGTFESALNLLDTLPLSTIAAASHSGSISPIPVPCQPRQFPIRRDPDLGIVCDSVFAAVNRPPVFRSWGLLDGGKYYGPDFAWTEVLQRRGWIHAWATWGVMMIATALLALSPVRWMARKCAPHQVGEGPSEEDMAQTQIEFHATSYPSPSGTHSKKAFLTFKGPDPYIITGIVMVEAALAVLGEEEIPARRMGGGVVTAACLASERLVERLKGSGVEIEARIVEE